MPRSYAERVAVMAPDQLCWAAWVLGLEAKEEAQAIQTRLILKAALWRQHGLRFRDQCAQHRVNQRSLIAQADRIPGSGHGQRWSCRRRGAIAVIVQKRSLRGLIELVHRNAGGLICR